MSNETGTVLLERRDTTAYITFDRPSVRNAMTWRMYEELEHAIDSLASEPAGLRVAVLRGAGGHFAAGTDIAQFAAFESAEDGVAYERRIDALIAKLEALPIATIAAVEGFAAGAGLVLAAACDLRVCTPNARFGAPIARTLGNCLSMANHARLVASLGVARTKALLLTAEFMSADEARAAGFVTEIIEPDVFEQRVDELAEQVATLAPITLQVTREAVHRMIARLTVEGDDLLRRVYGSRDFREGVVAFVEKRSPKWEGH